MQLQHAPALQVFPDCQQPAPPAGCSTTVNPVVSLSLVPRLLGYTLETPPFTHPPPSPPTTQKHFARNATNNANQQSDSKPILPPSSITHSLHASPASPPPLVANPSTPCLHSSTILRVVPVRRNSPGRPSRNSSSPMITRTASPNPTQLHQELRSQNG